MGDIGPVNAVLECAALSWELEVLSMHGVERLDQPYRFDLVVRLPELDSDATLLFEQDASLWLRRESSGSVVSERRIPGVCFVVEEGDAQLDHGVATVSLRPALEYGALGRRTRLFQEKSALDVAVEVLEELLGAFGRELQNDVRRTPPVREYCVQYAESDLDFVSRLLEEEGVAYGFDYTGDVEKLLLWDTASDVLPITTDEQIPFSDTTGAISDESVRALLRHDQTQSTGFALRDHAWTLDEQHVEHTIEGEDALGRVREVYEHGRGRSITHHGFSSRYTATDVEPRLELRQQELTQDDETYGGEGRAVGFAAGARFEMGGHPDALLDGAYTLRSVEHRMNVGDTGGYLNHFSAHLADREYRPRRTHEKPSITGSHTAIVTGAGGEEIHVDEHGRIRVQFDWDRAGADDEKSTCWVRCGEMWAGQVMGTLWRPRIGMEVIVSFEHGDPDRPVVTGCLYNGVNVPPYALPAEKTKSTIKSESTIGGGGFNEFRFEDKAGSEQVYLHAQKDLDEEVLNDHTTWVGANQTNAVGNDQTQTVGNDQTEQVDKTQEMTVGGDRTVMVHKTFDEVIIGGEVRKVTSGSEEYILKKGETHTTIGETTEIVLGGEERFIEGGFTETIVGDVGQMVMGPGTYMITGTQDVVALGGTTRTTPAMFGLTVGGETKLTGLAGGTITSPATTLMMATTINRQDGFWDFISPMSTSTVGTNTELIGVKLARGGLALGAGSMKFELKQIAIGRTAVKAAAFGVNVDLWMLDLDNDGADPEGFGVYIFLP